MDRKKEFEKFVKKGNKNNSKVEITERFFKFLFKLDIKLHLQRFSLPLNCRNKSADR